MTAHSSRAEAFLQRYFKRYDPRTGRCDLKFGDLSGRRVIFVGEVHKNQLHEKIQETFLHFFARKDACLLLEGLAYGTVCQANEVINWGKLPKRMTVMGADIRSSLSAEQYTKGYLYDKRRRLWTAQQNAKMITRTGKAFDTLFKERQKPLHKRNWQSIDAAFHKIYIPYKHCLSHFTQSSHPVRLLESNRALAERVKQVYRRYKQIIAIWGWGHFSYDPSFYQRLDHAGIRYTVLIPNEITLRCGADEYFLQNAPLRPRYLQVAERLYRIPMLSHLFFKYLSDPFERKITLHPARTHYHLKEEEHLLVPNFGYHIYAKLVEPNDRQNKLVHLIDLINSALVLHKLAVANIRIWGGYTKHITLSDNRPMVEITAQNGMGFSLMRCHTIKVHPRHLFTQMLWHKQERYSISNYENLQLTGLTVHEVLELLFHPWLLIKRLNQFAPHGSHLQIKGKFPRLEAIKLPNREILLSLTSHSGFSFQLT